MSHVLHQLHQRQRRHTSDGTYVELKPKKRIRYTDKLDEPNLPGEMQFTVNLKEVVGGTELHIAQEGVPYVILAEMCYQGWQDSLIQLAQLVDPEIPDEGARAITSLLIKSGGYKEIILEIYSINNGLLTTWLVGCLFKLKVVFVRESDDKS